VVEGRDPLQPEVTSVSRDSQVRKWEQMATRRSRTAAGGGLLSADKRSVLQAAEYVTWMVAPLIPQSMEYSEVWREAVYTASRLLSFMNLQHQVCKHSPMPHALCTMPHAPCSDEGLHANALTSSHLITARSRMEGSRAQGRWSRGYASCRWGWVRWRYPMAVCPCARAYIPLSIYVCTPH